jgi:hypothetical protein
MLGLIKTGSFTALGSDGKTYQVIEWSKRLPTGTLLDTSPQYETVLEKLTLSTGDHVNSLGPDEYQVLKTGVRLKRKRT